MVYIKRIIIAIIISCMVAGCGNNSNVEVGNAVNKSNSKKSTDIVDKNNTLDPTTDKQEVINGEQLVDALGIIKCDYSSKFILEGDLKNLLENMAVYYKDFNSDDELDEEAENAFIWCFCQNSWFGFDYLYDAADANGGYITSQQVEYIYYSFSGVYKKFEILGDDKIDVDNPSSGFLYANIKSYESESKGNEIVLNALFELSDGSEEAAGIVLVKNPYSCFDGYSVKSFKAK
ncbi:hypothetical protein SAMN02910298_02746 [Pseudobutyrivibrio sp. YE44]|nr:hypothetical protein SAMN02910298_02746 [Pseudobutyrivibrio sp. YE44]